MRARAILLAAIMAPTLLAVAACSRSSEDSSADPGAGDRAGAEASAEGVTDDSTSPTTRVPTEQDIVSLAEAIGADDPSPPEYIRCIAEAVADQITAEEVGGVIDDTRRTAYQAAAQTCFAEVFPTLDDDPAIAAFVEAPRNRRLASATAPSGSPSIDYSIELPDVLTDESDDFQGGNLFLTPEPVRGAPTFGVQVSVADAKIEPLSLTQAWDRLVDGSTEPEGLAWATVDGITSVVTGADAMTVQPVGDETWLLCRASIRGQASPMTQGVDDVARQLLDVCRSIEIG